MKVLCVLNPQSAGGLATKRWPDIAALLTRLGVEYELLAVQSSPLSAQVCERLTLSVPGEFCALAGIGGDGTHAGVINGLMRFRAEHPEHDIPPYAFIPLGTGNDIAKSLGIRVEGELTPSELRRAVSTVMHGAEYQLDLGVMNGVFFADAVTVGLDSRILRERNARKRMIEHIPFLRHLARGRLLYTLSTGALFAHHERVQCSITVDGREWYRGEMLNLVINNTRIYAGDFDFSVDAYADDGLLDVVLFAGQTDYLARYLLALRHNPYRVREFSDELHSRSQHIQGKRIEIRLSRPEAAQIDGEELPEGTSFDIEVVQRVLRVKTPAEPF